MAKWQQLMDLLEKKKKLLMGFSELLGMFREIESIGIEMSEMEVSCFLLLEKNSFVNCTKYVVNL